MFFEDLLSLKNYTHFFDFDGVIVDSVEIKTEAYAEIFSRWGKEAEAWIRQFHKRHGGVDRLRKIRLGLWHFALSEKERNSQAVFAASRPHSQQGSGPAQFRAVEASSRIPNKTEKNAKELPSLSLWDPPRGALGAWEEEVASLVDAFGKATRRRVEEAPYIPGIRNYLDFLIKNKVQMFVVSGAPEQELKEIVKNRGLWDYFTEVRGSPMHKPEILRELLERYQIQPQKSVFFGDAGGDFAAAQSVGMLFVGLPPSEFLHSQKM